MRPHRQMICYYNLIYMQKNFCFLIIYDDKPRPLTFKSTFNVRHFRHKTFFCSKFQSIRESLTQYNMNSIYRQKYTIFLCHNNILSEKQNGPRPYTAWEWASRFNLAPQNFCAPGSYSRKLLFTALWANRKKLIFRLKTEKYVIKLEK